MNGLRGPTFSGLRELYGILLSDLGFRVSRFQGWDFRVYGPIP